MLLSERFHTFTAIGANQLVDYLHQQATHVHATHPRKQTCMFQQNMMECRHSPEQCIGLWSWQVAVRRAYLRLHIKLDEYRAGNLWQASAACNLQSSIHRCCQCRDTCMAQPTPHAQRRTTLPSPGQAGHSPGLESAQRKSSSYFPCVCHTAGKIQHKMMGVTRDDRNKAHTS